MEFAREVNGVNYYIDSTGGSPADTVSMLEALDRRVILISCGYGEDVPCDILGPVLAEKAKHLILLGQNASMLELIVFAGLRGKNAYNDIRITHCSTLDQAVYSAYFSAKSGDSVLFSAVGGGIDAFKSSNDAREKFISILDGLYERNPQTAVQS